MATKLKTLSGDPEDFFIPITVVNLSGKELEIIFKCQGRTLKDWHPIFAQQLTDDANNIIDAETAKDEAKAEDDTKKKKQKRLEFNSAELDEAVNKGLGKTVAIIRKVAVGWDLEDEFSDVKLEELSAKFPGTHQKLWAEYDSRIRGNRLGNSKP
jgi:hypothetical protein